MADYRLDKERIVITDEEKKAAMDALHLDSMLSTRDELIARMHLIDLAITTLTSKNFDTLKACCETGPVFDGDLLSKSSRDYLISHGLVVRVIVKNSAGFNACTDAGAHAYNAINAILAVRKKKDAMEFKDFMKKCGIMF